MGGGLMQLVAYGAQDVYLTGNPQITFFKVVYRRHTNFSMESIEQTFNGTVAAGNKVTATISRNGDLIHRCYVQMKVTAATHGDDDTVGGPGIAKNADNVGHAALAEVEVEIGGQRIDKHYSQWLDIWADLTVPSGKKDGYDLMIDSSDKLYVPLQFWFCRNPGLALPLIALQYHEVKVNITFAAASVLGTPGAASVLGTPGAAPGNAATIDSASLWVDYIYLDTDERRRFAQVSHEYLIEQLQFTGVEKAKSNGSHRLNFNHPVKELVWVNNNHNAYCCEDAVTNWNTHLAVGDCKLQLNGHDRMAARDGSYFSLVQPYQHHTNVPTKTTLDADNNNNIISTYASLNINVYSFALKPEDHQPSGTCNMSRIDNATLHVTAKPANGNTIATGIDKDLYIFAVNYNVLRIMGGMGGLAYSN